MQSEVASLSSPTTERLVMIPESFLQRYKLYATKKAMLLPSDVATNVKTMVLPVAPGAMTKRPASKREPGEDVSVINPNVRVVKRGARC